MEAALLRRFYAGLDPWRLTFPQWQGAQESIAVIGNIEAGKTERVKLRQMLRRVRRGHGG